MQDSLYTNVSSFNGTMIGKRCQNVLALTLLPESDTRDEVIATELELLADDVEIRVKNRLQSEIADISRILRAENLQDNTQAQEAIKLFFDTNLSPDQMQ